MPLAHGAAMRHFDTIFADSWGCYHGKAMLCQHFWRIAYDIFEGAGIDIGCHFSHDEPHCFISDIHNAGAA